MTKRSAKAAGAMHLYLLSVLERRNSAQNPELWRVMKEIDDYVTSSFYLEINPLAELRRIIPQFQWRYCEIRTIKFLEIELSDVDYIWRTNWFSGDSSYKIVTATSRNCDFPQRLFFTDGGDEESAVARSKQVEFAKQLYCTPVSRILLRN